MSNEVAVLNEENRGRAWTVLHELKRCYTMAGKNAPDSALGDVAQCISHDLLCADNEIAEVFRRARMVKDIPTMAVLVKCFDQMRAENVSADPLPDISDARKAWERGRAYDQLQNWCYSNGWTDRWLFATEKIDGRWAHPEQMKKLKSDAIRYGFRYIKEEAAKSGPVMSLQDYVAKTGDTAIYQIIGKMQNACKMPQ